MAVSAFKRIATALVRANRLTSGASGLGHTRPGIEGDRRRTPFGACDTAQMLAATPRERLRYAGVRGASPQGHPNCSKEAANREKDRQVLPTLRLLLERIREADPGARRGRALLEHLRPGAQR